MAQVNKQVAKRVGLKCFNKDDKEVDCNLNGENVTIGALKNLVTDRPAPITKPLSAVQKNANGVPVLVNPVIATNTMGDANLKMDMLIGPDEVSIAKKKAPASKTLLQLNKDTNPDPVPTKVTIGSDELKDEEVPLGNGTVHSDKAVVGGNVVDIAQKKRITGLQSDDAPATFSWADHFGYEQKTLGDVQAINALA